MQPAIDPQDSDNTSFRALTELSPEFIALLDTAGVFLYVSPAVERVLGYQAQELIGHSFVDFVHADDREEAERHLARLLQTQAVITATRRYRHKDGSWRILEILGRNHTEVAALGGILVSTRDITRRFEQDRALREALAEVEDLYNHSSCGYHSLDENGVIVRINDTELQWLGYTREAVLGVMNFRDLLGPAAQSRFDRSFASFKRSGQAKNLEFELICKDGRRLPVLINATAIYDGAGRYIGSRSSVFDITARKQTQRLLDRVHRALRVRSSVNAVLIRAERESELLDAVCHLIVEHGGYRMAWVGSAQENRDRVVRVEAQAGFEEGYLQDINLTWEDSERGRGPTGTAIRTGEPQINRDFLHNPKVAPWRRNALARGYQSSIALPLKDGEKTCGCLTIYAAEPDAFDKEEVQLLVALADDLSFGVRMLRAGERLRQTQRVVEQLAYFDPRTGLPNRNRLMQQMTDLLAQPVRARPGLAVLTLMVERFGDIQAGIGIRQADQLLSDIANRLQVGLVEGEQLARTGGESFAVLQVPGDAQSAARCAASIHEVMLRPFQNATVPLAVQLNIGAALAPEHGEEADVLLVRSSSAARRARRSASKYQMYEGMSQAESPLRLGLITDLRRAIERAEIAVHFQPKIDVALGTVSGAEALVRWTHPQRGEISPASFIPMAEQTGLIRPLTRLVLETVVRQISAWRRQGFALPVAVNVSARDFDDPQFVDHVLGLVEREALAPESLQLEITESTLMDDPARVREQLLRLAERGISLSIDDFGTGYSSLGYVANLPIQSLKIDRSFVIQMMGSRRVHSVVSATISLAQALGMHTVAEGVDLVEQAEELRRLGCRELQGFLFSAAMPAERFPDWVRQFRPGGQTQG